MIEISASNIVMASKTASNTVSNTVPETASETASEIASAPAANSTQPATFLLPISSPCVPEELNIKHYDDPLTEQVYDNNEHILEEIVARHRPEEVRSVEDVPVRKISIFQALSALETLSLYEIQQDDGDVGY